eukprot:13819671-Alexandrium_andersonii.AAC.1
MTGPFSSALGGTSGVCPSQGLAEPALPGYPTLALSMGLRPRGGSFRGGFRSSSHRAGPTQSEAAHAWRLCKARGGATDP